MSASIDAAPSSHFIQDPLHSVAELSNSFVPAPLRAHGRDWIKWFGPTVSVLILCSVAYQLRSIDFGSLVRLLPSALGFWIAFAAYYAAGPLSEWVIFRRLWKLPASGIAALFCKLISNELLLGYLGEVYFYAWARRTTRIATAPFGAIKDVAILSAVMGNVFTLVMVMAAAPFLDLLRVGVGAPALLGAAIVVLVSSLALILLRGRVFTLPPRELRFVALVHAVRIVATMLLMAWMWHMILPAVAISWWVLLGTLRQLLSRLPLVPNKDVVFAGIASLLVGQDHEIVAVMALMATLLVATHVIVGSLLGAAELARPERAR
jgi:hypothetical protein